MVGSALACALGTLLLLSRLGALLCGCLLQLAVLSCSIEDHACWWRVNARREKCSSVCILRFVPSLCLFLLQGPSRCCPHTAFCFWRAPQHHKHESGGRAPLATVCAPFQTVQWTSSRVGLKSVE